MATQNIQLKDGNGNLLMPRTNILTEREWVIPTTGMDMIPYTITSQKNWAYNSNRKSLVTKIFPDTKYTIYAGDLPVMLNVLKSYTRPSGHDLIDISSIVIGGQIRIEANTSYELVASSEANYIVFNLYTYDTSKVFELPKKITYNESEILDDYAKYREDIVKPNSVYQISQLIFTDDDVKEGDNIYFDTQTDALPLSCYIELMNEQNERLAYFGKSSSSDTEYRKTGHIIIPNGFKYAVVAGFAGVNLTIHTLRVDNGYKYIDIDNFTKEVASLSESVWGGSVQRKAVFIPVNAGDTFKISTDEPTYYAFLRTNSHTSNELIDFADGCKRVILITDDFDIIQAPHDALYLCIQTYLTSDISVTLEKLSQSDYFNMVSKSSAANTLAQNAKVISDERYLYAFTPQPVCIGSHVKVVYAANENTTDGDSYLIDNDNACADVDILTNEVTTTVRPVTTSFVDSNGNTIAGLTKHLADLNVKYGNDIGLFTIMTDGVTDTYSYGYNHSFGSDVVTRCKLTYNNTTVEFTIENYRQMLVDMGYLPSYIQPVGPLNDNMAFCEYNGQFYTVICGHRVGENQEYPLVLLSSTDLATWTVEGRLGTKTHKALEISMTIKDDVVYLCYRYQLDRAGTVNGIYGYHICSYDIGGTENYDIFKNSYIISCPLVFQANGIVWVGYNERPMLAGNPSNVNHPYGRQQMAFYRAYKDHISYVFSLENPDGFNYPKVAVMETLDSGTPISNLDRVYMVFSEDRRNLNYRQINNVSFCNMTSVFCL